MSSMHSVKNAGIKNALYPQPGEEAAYEGQEVCKKIIMSALLSELLFADGWQGMFSIRNRGPMEVLAIVVLSGASVFLVSL